MTRVSTAFLNTNILRQMQESSVQLSETSYQVSSGQRAQQLSQISSDASSLLRLQDLSDNSNIYVKNMETAQTRLDATENALSNMQDLVTESASLWTLARNENTAETRAALAPRAEGLLESFYSIMQTEFDGRYIFSGQDGDTAPISGTPAAVQFGGNPPSTTYYQGDTARAQIITGPAQSSAYGVTGDQQAFAQLKQGLESLWYGLSNNSETDIEGGIELLEGAERGLSDLVGQIGGQKSTFTLQIDRYEQNQVFLQERIDEIDKVDITEAMTQFTQEQAALEASMLVITQLNRVSLLNFLN